MTGPVKIAPAPAPAPGVVSGADPGALPGPAAAVTGQLRFSPEQFARFEALVEAARRKGLRVTRKDLVLEALEYEAAGHAPRSDEASATHVDRATPVHRSPYQVVVCQCETCGKGHIPTSRGDRVLDLATLRAIVCDSDVVGQGKRLRASGVHSDQPDESSGGTSAHETSTS